MLPLHDATPTIVPDEFLKTDWQRTCNVDMPGHMPPMTEEELLSSNFDTLRWAIIDAEYYKDESKRPEEEIEKYLASLPENLKLTWCVAAMFNRSMGSRYTSDAKSENGKNYRTERLKGLKKAIKYVTFRDMPIDREEQLLHAWSPYKLAYERYGFADLYEDASEKPNIDDEDKDVEDEENCGISSSQSTTPAFSSHHELSSEKHSGSPNSNTTSKLFRIQELVDLLSRHVVPHEYDEPVKTPLFDYERGEREREIQIRREKLQSLRFVSGMFYKSATERLFRSYTFRPRFPTCIESAGSLIRFEQRTQGPAVAYVQQLKIFDLDSMARLGLIVRATFHNGETQWPLSDDEEAQIEKAELTAMGENWLIQAIQRLPNLRSITLSGDVDAFWELAKLLSNAEQHKITELVVLTGMPTLTYNTLNELGITGDQCRNFFSKMKSLKVFGHREDRWAEDTELDAYHTPLGKICREASMPNLTQLEVSNITKYEQLPLPEGKLQKLRSISLDRVNLTADDLLQLLSKTTNLEKLNLTKVKLTAGFWAPCIRRLTELLHGNHLKELKLRDLGYQWGGPAWAPYNWSLPMNCYVFGEEFRSDKIGPLRSLNPADRKALSAFVTAHKEICADARILGPASEVLEKVESRPIKLTRCAGFGENKVRCEKNRELKPDEIACEASWLCEDHCDQEGILEYFPYGAPGTWSL